ncbi:MAG: hypothetical protein HYX69_21135 [Planctomycetia bacterium]|nr:hypothetical protein [Planctomycetia bacterium]
MPDTRGSHPPPSRPLTDSPFFWMAIFAVAGLVALTAIAPKYARRQARMERMGQTRERVARGGPGTVAPAAAEEPGDFDVPAEAPSARFSLRPLAVALSILLAVAAVGIGAVGYLRTASRHSQSSPGDSGP